MTANANIKQFATRASATELLSDGEGSTLHSFQWELECGRIRKSTAKRKRETELRKLASKYGAVRFRLQKKARHQSLSDDECLEILSAYLALAEIQRERGQKGLTHDDEMWMSSLAYSLQCKTSASAKAVLTRLPWWIQRGLRGDIF